MNAQIEDRFFDMYLQFFKISEERRRWKLFKDIPWSQVNRKVNPLVVSAVEASTAVEMFLPDYAAKVMQMFRKSRGRAWFIANWAYEESKHSLTLGEWLIRTGARDEKQLRAFENSLLDGG